MSFALQSQRTYTISAEMQVIFCSILIFFFHSSVIPQVNAENAVENGEDNAQFHDKMSHQRGHLLAHLADRMDLDGEGLRHIKKHLGEQTLNADGSKDLKDVADGDNSKGIFYFFKFHDYDNNEKLDGLEWMQALTDFHQDDDSKEESKEGGKVFLEHEAEAIIDELLSKHDADDDGMIDFLELMNSNVESIMTDLDKPQPGGNEEQAGESQKQNTEEPSSLEQEFNQLQENAGQQDNQESHEDQQQDNQESHEDQQQDHQQQKEPQQEDQLHEQDNQQQQENKEQELNSENGLENQGTDQEQEQNEPSSLEEEYNRQQQQS